jgi:lipoprotein-releasing system permease protein
MSEYDASIIYMPLRRRSSISMPKAWFSRSRCSSTSPTISTALRPLVEAAADRQVFITDWRQRNQTFFNALQVERNVMFMILTLIILVAALNIVPA